MKNSYRGQGVKGNADYIQSQGFKGQNEGALTNLLKMVYGSYKAYKTLPPDLRYKWFGDKRALQEDMSSKNPMLDADGRYRYEVELEKREREKAEKAKQEADALQAANDAVEKSKYGEGSMRYEDELNTPYEQNGADAWNADELASSSHEHFKSEHPDYGQVGRGYATDSNEPTADSIKEAKTGSWNTEGRDNTLAWQRFLRKQGYKIGLDGNWQGKTQESYDHWVANHPEYQQ